jgi:hypothetical protein
VIQVAPIDLLLRVSAASIGAVESPANTNRGPYVERVLALVGLEPGNPWCAADVANSGINALGDQWPVPHTGSCQMIFEWATKRGIVHPTPARGDIFLVWHPELGRFAHTGLVELVPASGPVTTHEGNTSGAGSREGWLKARRQRTFGPKDVFARWVDALGAI